MKVRRKMIEIRKKEKGNNGKKTLLGRIMKY